MPEFTDTKFMTAKQKEQVYKAWLRFWKGGHSRQKFTKALYNHLIMHCGFIAHFNRGGFYAEYFEDPSTTQRFLNQFDRGLGCRGVETGAAWWVQGGNDVTAEYYDINNAMVDAIQKHLPEMRAVLRADEKKQAEAGLAAAQEKVDSFG